MGHEQASPREPTNRARIRGTIVVMKSAGIIEPALEPVNFNNQYWKF
jgi:hypothetical protein